MITIEILRNHVIVYIIHPNDFTKYVGPLIQKEIDLVEERNFKDIWIELPYQFTIRVDANKELGK